MEQERVATTVSIRPIYIPNPGGPNPSYPPTVTSQDLEKRINCQLQN